MYIFLLRLTPLICIFNCFHLGNIALNHFTRDAKLSRKSGKEKSLTTDGILKGGKCFSRTDKDSFWWLKFGSRVRVAMVFLMHSEDSYITKSGIEIKVGSGKCIMHRSIRKFDNPPPGYLSS